MNKEKKVLNIELRTEKGKNNARRARRAGAIPGILYCKGKDSVAVSVAKKDWSLFSHKDAHLIDIKLSDGEAKKALVKEVQEDYLKNMVLHIDLQEVRMDEIIKTAVKIHPKGTPVGEAMGGILEQPMHAVLVSCLAAKLPDAIEVDVSLLDVNQVIHVKDLVLPEGVKCEDTPDVVVFHVLIPSAVEATVAAAADAADAAAATPAAGTAAPAAAAAPAADKKDAKEKKK